MVVGTIALAAGSAAGFAGIAEAQPPGGIDSPCYPLMESGWNIRSSPDFGNNIVGHWYDSDEWAVLRPGGRMAAGPQSNWLGRQIGDVAGNLSALLYHPGVSGDVLEPLAAPGPVKEWRKPYDREHVWQEEQPEDTGEGHLRADQRPIGFPHDA